MNTTALPRIAFDPLIDASFKGYPPDAQPLRVSQVGDQGWHVLGDDLPMPLAVLDRAALAHNTGWLQTLVRREGLGLAPHGKTTLSPQLFAAQLAAGAWGITVSQVRQIDAVIASGGQRVLIANQVVQPAELRQLAGLLTRHPGLRAPFLVDAVEQVEIVEAVKAIAAVGAPQAARPFEVLLEVGLAGGRTGCRTVAEALELARRVRASPAVRLVGISTYEGLWGSGDDSKDRPLVDGLVRDTHALARACEAEGLFEADEVILTAGGSALFDLIAPALRGPTGDEALQRPVLGLLRSGCYVTHDDGHYQRLVRHANRRLGCSEADGLRAALTVWAVVQATPEPGLVILDAGKRDLSFDMGLPVPKQMCRRGERVAVATPAAWQVVALNDQHAHLRLHDADPALAPRIGDRIGLGISHPCTTFDKWRWMPVADGDGRIVDAITTGF
ncbi:alanine racemase [Sphaerotilus mobilis]|uniref:D-serine dehydratase n=1 Tax=Sphaerotilus mobilis TaxID=47994 RepID=A0A4Q7LRG7_9BURK|nr:alanine racemase [Sphaerotilus mobilis]RZS56812.1 D-serine dehydratase [Sphaerotilus mobilis]